MLSWIWPGWIFPPQSEGIRRGRRESRPVEKRGAHSCERARSHIARPFPRDYFAMYTMIDAIGARTGARAARAPNSHRVRPQLCLGSARQLQGSRTYPSSKPFAVATVCVAQPPRDCIPRAARSLHQPASLAAAAAAADAKELMSVAGGVLGGGEARRMRFDVAMKNLASEVHGAVRSRDGPGLSPAALAGASHPSRPTSSARPSPRTVEPTPDRPAARPQLTHPPDISQYGEFPLTGLLKLLEHPAVDEALHAAEHKEGSVDEADKISRAHAFFEDCDPSVDGSCDLEHTPTRFSRV